MKKKSSRLKGLLCTIQHSPTFPKATRAAAALKRPQLRLWDHRPPPPWVYFFTPRPSPSFSPRRRLKCLPPTPTPTPPHLLLLLPLWGRGVPKPYDEGRATRKRCNVGPHTTEINILKDSVLSKWWQDLEGVRGAPGVFRRSAARRVRSVAMPDSAPGGRVCRNYFLMHICMPHTTKVLHHAHLRSTFCNYRRR